MGIQVDEEGRHSEEKRKILEECSRLVCCEGYSTLAAKIEENVTRLRRTFTG